MKKSTLLRKIAYPAAPQYADGFVPPAGYDYKMLVGLRDISIKVYGFDGTSWTMLHDTDGIIEDFITDVSYQKYYFESKTPDQQTVRVSFMSSQDETDTHTFDFGVTSTSRKLHHLGDVPIYRQSQAGKFLTVMSDGTLQWLDEDESYIVPSEGGEENQEDSSLVANGDATIVDGTYQTNGGYFSALWSDYVAYTGDTPDNSDFTVAFWWKHGETPVAGVTPTFGLFSGRNDSLNEGMNYFIMDHASSGVRLQTNFGPSYFANRTDLISEDPNVEHPWNHFVFTRTATTTKTYWNGALVANHGANFPWVPNSATAQLQLGATDENGANSAFNTLFEDFEIRDGDAMSAADVAALYSAGRSGAPSPTLLSQAVLYGDASYDASTDVVTFDGTGDYATFGGDYAFTDAITVAAWFKTTAGGDRRIMSSHVRSSSQFLNGWFMRLHHGRLKYRHPSGGAGELTGPPNLNNGEWQHVAMTWTPSGYVLYVNGAQYASGGASVADGYDMTFNLHIGANSWNGNSPYAFFNGQVGGAMVENEVMTAQQIQDIYDNGPENAGTTAGLEESSNLTLHGNAQLIDGVLAFDGTVGTYASIPHSTDYDRENGDLSISMWMNANSLPANWNGGLVSKMGAGWSGYITAISTMAADDGSGDMTEGGLQTTTWISGGGNNNNRSKPTGGVAINTWHHVAFIMPATGDYKMYFNGQEVHSYVPNVRNTTTSGDLRIGGWQNGAYHGYFDGQIDGIVIEKTAKTAAEVLSEYNSGH